MTTGRFTGIVVGTGLAGTDNTDGTITVDAVSVGPIDDAQVWMPLTTTVGGDDVLVFDAGHSLIPTLIPI